MKHKYTKKQIVEAIKYWEKQIKLGNYRKLNESSSEFKKIDDIVEYLAGKKDLKWTKVYKFQRINARQSEGGEEIETVGSDGNKETKRTTKKGDWVVNNVSNPDNKWIIDDKTFQRKYEKDSKDGVYKPKGDDMLAAKISDCEDAGVEFAPPNPNWNGAVIKMKNDGYFIKDLKNKKDIYAISNDDFESTYKPVSEKGKKLSEDIDQIQESKISDFFNKLFKTKKFLANQKELERQKKDAEFRSEHPLVEITEKMNASQSEYNFKFTNAETWNGGKPFDFYKEYDCIVARYSDSVGHRYDRIADDEDAIMKIAHKYGVDNDYKFYPLDVNFAVIMPKQGEFLQLQHVNDQHSKQ